MYSAKLDLPMPKYEFTKNNIHDVVSALVAPYMELIFGNSGVGDLHVIVVVG